MPVAESGADSFVRDGDHIVYDAPAVGRFACGVDSIEVTPVAGADPDVLARLLIANALPATLWQRGKYLLHCSALYWREIDACVAICGPSGSGKSMLAAQWLDRGAQLIADDVLALGADGDLQKGSGLPGGIHLPRDEHGNRCFRPVSPDQSLPAARIGAILILHRGAANQPANLTRLSGIAAVEALLQNRHRPVVPALLGRGAAVLEQASTIAATVPVWRWSRPDGATTVSGRERQVIMAACSGQ